ncbi:hypothetical protein [Microbulbifer okhotskensis]|nr:hypothetical protein [Microbulbifer okhotskensis]
MVEKKEGKGGGYVSVHTEFNIDLDDDDDDDDDDEWVSGEAVI